MTGSDNMNIIFCSQGITTITMIQTLHITSITHTLHYTPLTGDNHWQITDRGKFHHNNIPGLSKIIGHPILRLITACLRG